MKNIEQFTRHTAAGENTINNKTDVVIPVHNEVEWLAVCLEELFRFESSSLNRVILVNDRSDDDQYELIQQLVAEYRSIELINNESSSGGFGYACNLGASASNADYLIFLNTDCLITDLVIDNLSLTLARDQSIALACPLSNNSPNLTYELPEGFSYRDVADGVGYSNFSDVQPHAMTPLIDVSSIVGNCLAVRRSFFDSVSGFCPTWGLGYGEETDLHMKAVEAGYRGVAHVGCYVYHYGGGTFNHKPGIEKHRKRNLQAFLNKWDKQFKNLSKRYPPQVAVSTFEKRLFSKNKITSISLDVLFYMPGLDQGIGGLNSIVSVCNDLIRNGIRAGCALVDPQGQLKMRNYKGPLFFNFLHFSDEQDFLNDRRIKVKIVFSTLYSTAEAVSNFSKRRGALPIQFIQGYEPYFDNGIAYKVALDSYQKTKRVVTTSNWLVKMVSRHLLSDTQVDKLPLPINPYIFYPGSSERKYDVAILLRSSADKGQWLLLETLDRLVEAGLSLVVFCAAQYTFVKDLYGHDLNILFIDLPKSQKDIANKLRQSKLLVDLSHHEGFGLTALEASMCGCRVVVSDSGGPSEYMNQSLGSAVPIRAEPDSLLLEIQQQLNCFGLSPELNLNYDTRGAAVKWVAYIESLLSTFPPSTLHTIRIDDADCKVEAPEIFETEEVSRDSSATNRRIFLKVKRFIPLRIKIALKVLLTGRT